eukprot:g7787.t1
MADVVDLADSDDDVQAQAKVHEEVDLGGDDLVMVAAAPAQPGGRATRRKSGGAGGGAGSGAVCHGAASKNSPNRNKRAKRDVGSAASGAAGGPSGGGGAVVAVLDVDDDGPGDGGGGGNGAKTTCAACWKEVRSPFTLERCGHALCPSCVMTISTPTQTCPAAACSEFVSVRDLALILTESKWAELQEKRLEDFRALAEKKGSRCPTCKAWVEIPRPVGGTASQRAKRLLACPPLVCLQGHSMCQSCGTTLKKQAPPCDCGGARLLAFRGLLSLLEELVAEPASVALCGPVGKLPKAVTAAAAAPAARGGRGGGRGRGRGGGAYAYTGGRGGGGRGGGMWKTVVNGLSGYGGGHGYGGGGGGGGEAEKISSKWSKGTGYGGSGDAAAAAETQAVAAEAEARSDKAMVVVFDALAACLPKRGDLPDHLPELLALVRESSLLQLVCSYLRNDSLMDIAKRRGLYQSLFNLILGFALHELLAPLIDHVPPKGGGGVSGSGKMPANRSSDSGTASSKGKGKGRGTDSAAAGGGAAAAQGDDGDDELAVVGVSGGGGGGGCGERASEEQEDEDEDVSVADLLANTNRQAKVFAQAPGAGEGKGGDAETLAFAVKVTKVYDQVKASLTYLRGLAEARASSPAVVALTAAIGAGGVCGAGLGRKRKREAADIVEVSLESRYLSELGDSRFELVPLLGHGKSHHFSSQASKQRGRTGGRARAQRVNKEVSTLATSLPVQPDSSIFLRVDEDRFDVMRAMITGPKDTPYEGGCFEFDIMLPPDYPNKPPQVHFLTTGNGRVRFNPNLYNTGKVCLSLLGTWSGPGWNAKTSTLLQVLISIQSLIFVAEPYFNEPGFEGQLGTPQGRAASSSYNSRIRNGTLMVGIVEALEKNSGAMADVKRTHFRLMKGQIIRTARAWLNDLAHGSGGGGDPRYWGGGQNAGCSGNYASMSKGQASETGSRYREMLEHLRNRFIEEIEVLRSKYGEVDQDALIVKLLMEEFCFTTVEVDDLAALRTQPRDKDKVYLLGETNFGQRPPSTCLELTNLNPKALEMVGDEQLATVARQALPPNTKTSKKAVELMGSNKVVTEKKALKRLGSEMSDSMRVLQLKTERKEQKEEEHRRLNVPTVTDAGDEGAEGAGASGQRAAVDGIGASGDKALGPKGSLANLKVGSPGSFAASPMARRATRLLTEVPKFISDMGMGGGSKADLSK